MVPLDRILCETDSPDQFPNVISLKKFCGRGESLIGDDDLDREACRIQAITRGLASNELVQFMDHHHDKQKPPDNESGLLPFVAYSLFKHFKAFRNYEGKLEDFEAVLFNNTSRLHRSDRQPHHDSESQG